MITYTENQAQEMVQEAVAKTELSFGGTFQRLKEENEKLQEMRKPAKLFTYRNFAKLVIVVAKAGLVTIEHDELANDVSLYTINLETRKAKAIAVLADLSTCGLLPIQVFAKENLDIAVVSYWVRVKHDEQEVPK